MTHHAILYTSFDEVPGPKGASTHIEAFARRLGEAFGDVWLVTPGPQDASTGDLAPGVRQTVLGCPDDNPLGRCRTFRSKLSALLRRESFDFVHFRSIFEGLPLLDPDLRKGAKVLYEVNGLPSIEMKYHYPQLRGAEATLAKLIDQETACLVTSDAVVTVSHVTRHYLQDRLASMDGTVPPIHVIPNGVDFAAFPFQYPPVPDDKPAELLYFGTSAPWQGVELLLRAVARLLRSTPCQLSVAGPIPTRRRRQLDRLVSKLQLEDHVDWIGPVSQDKLLRLLHKSHTTIVPLLPVDRNVVQGCCPLKLLEALAAGCPVVASDLPVVREIATPDVHFRAFRPDDLHSLVHRIEETLQDVQTTQRMAQLARRHVEQHNSWKAATDRLLEVYRHLDSRRSASSRMALRSPSG